MKPEFRPISISVVSILGIFAPGIVWATLFVIFLDRIGLRVGGAAYLSTLGLTLDRQPWAFAAGFLFGSFLIGAVLRPIVVTVAEYLCRPEAFFRARANGRCLGDYLFPYKYKYEKPQLYSRICDSLSRVLGYDVPPEYSHYEPFSSCKRVLRAISPRIAEELEYAEAESRLMGSLFLAAGFAFLLASGMPWIVLTTCAFGGLGYAFRRYREREVRYVYLNFSLATSGVPGRSVLHSRTSTLTARRAKRARRQFTLRAL